MSHVYIPSMTCYHPLLNSAVVQFPCFPTYHNNIVKFTFLMTMAQCIKFTFHACFPCFPGSSNPNYLPEGDPWTHNMNTLIFIQKVDKFPNFHPKKRPNFPSNSPFNQAISLTFIPGPCESPPGGGPDRSRPAQRYGAAGDNASLVIFGSCPMIGGIWSSTPKKKCDSSSQNLPKLPA